MNREMTHMGIDSFLENEAKQRGLLFAPLNVFGLLNHTPVAIHANYAGFEIRVQVPPALDNISVEHVIEKMRMHNIKVSKREIEIQDGFVKILTIGIFRKTVGTNAALIADGLTAYFTEYSRSAENNCELCKKQTTDVALLKELPHRVCGECQMVKNVDLTVGVSHDEFLLGKKDFKKTGARHSLVLLGLFLLGLGPFFLVDSYYPEYNIIDRSNLIWFPISAHILMSILLIFLLSKYPEFKKIMMHGQIKNKKGLIVILVIFVPFVTDAFGFGLGIFLNCAFDSSSPVQHRVRIEKGEHGFLRLKDLKTGDSYRFPKIPKRRDFGANGSRTEGDEFVLLVKDGNLGMPWIYKISLSGEE